MENVKIQKSKFKKNKKSSTDMAESGIDLGFDFDIDCNYLDDQYLFLPTVKVAGRNSEDVEFYELKSSTRSLRSDDM